MAERAKAKKETTAPAAEEAPAKEAAPAADEKPQVEVELNPDYKVANEDGELDAPDEVSVEVGPFPPLKLTAGKPAKVDADHAFLLNDVPAVRRVQ